MNPPIKAESSLAAIDGETGVDKTTSSFSLPFRAPQKTLHTKLAPLSNIHSTQVQNYDKERDNLMTSIVNTYSANRLGLTLWTCKVWGKRATDIIHAATSMLCALGSAISDVLIPVCKSEVCSTQGHTMAKDGTTRLPTSELTTCENCGNKSNMKLCAGAASRVNIVSTVAP